MIIFLHAFLLTPRPTGMTRTDFFRLFIPHPSLRYLFPCHAQCLQVFILTKTGRFPFRQQKRKIPAVHLPLLYGYFLFSSVLRIIRIIFMDFPCRFYGFSMPFLRIFRVLFADCGQFFHFPRAVKNRLCNLHAAEHTGQLMDTLLPVKCAYR